MTLQERIYAEAIAMGLARVYDAVESVLADYPHLDITVFFDPPREMRRSNGAICYPEAILHVLHRQVGDKSGEWIEVTSPRTAIERSLRELAETVDRKASERSIEATGSTIRPPEMRSWSERGGSDPDEIGK